MLIFMVVQLAGSAGTYPLEVSGSFVPALHGWVPFTYTVQAFRSTISGGESDQGMPGLSSDPGGSLYFAYRRGISDPGSQDPGRKAASDGLAGVSWAGIGYS